MSRALHPRQHCALIALEREKAARDRAAAMACQARGEIKRALEFEHTAKCREAEADLQERSIDV